MFTARMGLLCSITPRRDASVQPNRASSWDVLNSHFGRNKPIPFRGGVLVVVVVVVIAVGWRAVASTCIFAFGVVIGDVSV